MNDDLTRNLTPRSFEERALAELAATRRDFTSQLAATAADFFGPRVRADKLEGESV